MLMHGFALCGALTLVSILNKISKLDRLGLTLTFNSP